MGALLEGALVFLGDAIGALGGILEAVGVGIYEAVSAAVEAVVSGIGAATSAIVSAVEFAGAQLGIAIDEVTDFFVSTYENYIDPLVTPVEEFVSGVADKFIEFAEALHLREILLAHNILWQILPAYRKMMTNVFRAIGDWARAAAPFGALITQYLSFAHASFMLMGTIAGNDYLTNQIRWMKTLKETVFAETERLNHFAAYPWELPNWFDEQVLAPMMNKTAENQNKLYENLMEINKDVTEFHQRLADVDSALQNWIESAPDQWRDDIRKSVGPVADQLHDFRVNDFAPWKAKLDIIVGELREDRDKIVSQLDKPGLLFEKTLRPGAPERDRQLDTMDATLSAALARTRRRINERRARS